MPPKSTTTRKRKSDTDAGASNSKKARTTTTDHPAAIRVDSILANKSAYTIPEDEEETRKMLVLLSEYARTMKLKRAAAESSGVSASKK
ncbi:hypothetical protein BC629DRAFT_1575995 [Irpex lacteus]|nr:hypothetical protein BC629DRAFT_1575995 [Irpex lacteus]